MVLCPMYSCYDNEVEREKTRAIYNTNFSYLYPKIVGITKHHTFKEHETITKREFFFINIKLACGK